MTTITATYSPEDNKLRLYASSRLDQETYEKVKAAGFKWAPRQELFVAPKWSPNREDLAVELAGEIEPEEMTLAERAQAKAERLDELAHKRHRDANAYQRAAQALSEQFSSGQPILVGHHSERKARKAHDRMTSADRNAKKNADLANYWLYRAEGVEAHANYKNDPRTRARRIKTLLAELRDHQGTVNHFHAVLRVWDIITEEKLIIEAINRGQIATGPLTAMGDYWALEKGEKTAQQIRQESIDRAQRAINSGYRNRWIIHTLNRLSYERELLGSITRHEGDLRETAIQMFAREHGAHKPKATATDIGFVLETSVPLPAHIADGKTLELSSNEWCDLMRDCGYSIPDVKRNEKPPILNFKAGFIHCYSPYERGKVIIMRQVEMTKEQYMKWHSEQRGTRLSKCGGFSVRVCPDPFHEGPRYQAERVAVFLSNSKVHPKPESGCILDTMPKAAE